MCKESFLLKTFFDKNKVERRSKYENTKNGHFRISLTPRCASHCGVELRGVHHSAESSSAVCIIPRSQGYQLPQKTPQCASYRVVKLRGVQCASYRGVELRDVHHTAELSSAVCITPRSQTAHCGVKIEIIGSLWLLLKGHSGKILLGVNYSIM